MPICGIEQTFALRSPKDPELAVVLKEKAVEEFCTDEGGYDSQFFTPEAVVEFMFDMVSFDPL